MGYQTPVSSNAASGGSAPASAAGTLQLTFVSQGAVSAHRLVYAGATGLEVADKDVLDQQSKLVGVTITSAAASGESVIVVTEGKITDPSFTFIPGPIWLGNAGVLTQVKPLTGLLIQVAVAISDTIININIGLAIRLA